MLGEEVREWRRGEGGNDDANYIHLPSVVSTGRGRGREEATRLGRGSALKAKEEMKQV